MPRSSAMMSRMLGLEPSAARTSHIPRSKQAMSRGPRTLRSNSERWARINTRDLEGKGSVSNRLAGHASQFPLS